MLKPYYYILKLTNQTNIKSNRSKGRFTLFVVFVCMDLGGEVRN